MRRLLVTFALLVALCASAPPMPASALALPAYMALPGADQVPDGLAVVDEGIRTFEDHTSYFPDPGETRRLFRSWGWEENAYRVFARPGSDPADILPPYVLASVTRFSNPVHAQEALTYFIGVRLLDPLMTERKDSSALGDAAKVIEGRVNGGYERTLYVVVGSDVIRVSTGTGGGVPVVSPEPVAATMVQTLQTATAMTDTASSRLPLALNLPYWSCFRSVDAEQFKLADLASSFSESADAARVLMNLGWQDGAARSFSCAAPPAQGLTFLGVSVNRFGSAVEALAAMDYLAEQRMADTQLLFVAPPALPVASKALFGPSEAGSDFTLYAASDQFVYRVTGVAPSGTGVDDVAKVMLALLAGETGPPPTATPTPTMTPAPTSTSTPTATLEPTATPTMTITPYPTYTPFPTYTPLPTYTPNPTFTPVPTQPPTPAATEQPVQETLSSPPAGPDHQVNTDLISVKSQRATDSRSASPIPDMDGGAP
jgi:hypothetical protein